MKKIHTLTIASLVLIGLAAAPGAHAENGPPPRVAAETPASSQSLKLLTNALKTDKYELKDSLSRTARMNRAQPTNPHPKPQW